MDQLKLGTYNIQRYVLDNNNNRQLHACLDIEVDWQGSDKVSFLKSYIHFFGPQSQEWVKTKGTHQKNDSLSLGTESKDTLLEHERE